MKNTFRLESEPASQISRGFSFSVDTALTGEERLLLALLISAIDDLRTEAGVNRRRAFAWVSSKNEGAFSFLGICEFFNLSAERVKRLISA